MRRWTVCYRQNKNTPLDVLFAATEEEADNFIDNLLDGFERENINKIDQSAKGYYFEQGGMIEKRRHELNG